MTIDARASFTMRGFHAAMPSLRGVSPAGAGWRLDLADGTSRPATQAEINAATAWADARIAEAAADEAVEGNVKGAAAVRQLMTSSLADIDAYVESTATNIAGVRTVLKLILRVCVLVARRTLR